MSRYTQLSFEIPATTLGGQPRLIHLAVPQGLPGQRFPVLYMHDGQNLFRNSEASYGTSWSMTVTLEALGLEVIVVGIESGQGLDRLDELSAWSNDWIQHKTDFITRTVGGKGDAYLDFLVDELKPHIDRTFPTLPGRDTTWLAGSSMGGLASLYGAYRHPDVFSRAACFSSAFWFAADQLAAFLRTVDVNVMTKVYLDVGTEEGSRQHNEEERLSYINDSRRLHDQLAAQGLGPDRLKLVIDEGGLHNEAAWARRLPDALRWLLDGR